MNTPYFSPITKRRADQLKIGDRDFSYGIITKIGRNTKYVKIFFGANFSVIYEHERLVSVV
jgi:hypothetical protein